MFEKPGTERVMRRIATAYQEASDGMRLSIFYQASALTPQKDVVSHEVLASIGWMLGETRKGFQLTQRCSDNVSKQLRELNTYPIDQDNVVAQARTLLGLESSISESVEESGYLAYLHFLFTMNMLKGLGSFSYADLPDADSGFNLGSRELQVTWWRSPNHPDFLWEFLRTLTTTVQTVLQEQDVQNQNMLPVGHFFAAGSTIAPRELIS